jgi:hypothetical protein
MNSNNSNNKRKYDDFLQSKQQQTQVNKREDNSNKPMFNDEVKENDTTYEIKKNKMTDPVIRDGIPYCECLYYTVPMESKICKNPTSKWDGAEYYSCATGARCNTRPVKAVEMMKAISNGNFGIASFVPDPVCVGCHTKIVYSEVIKYREYLKSTGMYTPLILEEEVKRGMRRMACSDKDNGYTCVACVTVAAGKQK